MIFREGLKIGQPETFPLVFYSPLLWVRLELPAQRKGSKSVLSNFDARWHIAKGQDRLPGQVRP